MFKIVQQFGTKDNYGTIYRIAHVEYSDLPEWVEPFVVKCDAQDIRFALDRHGEPLTRLIQLKPKQILTRIPAENIRCQIWKGCVAWRERTCMNMNKNVCRVYEAPAPTLEQRVELTDLMNLWREGWNVVKVDTDSRR